MDARERLEDERERTEGRLRALRRDFTGFKGDRKFVRDDQAQKAFSKLRSSIAGSSSVSPVRSASSQPALPVASLLLCSVCRYMFSTNSPSTFW